MKLPYWQAALIIGILAFLAWGAVFLLWKGLLPVKPFLIVYLILIVIGAVALIGIIHGGLR